MSEFANVPSYDVDVTYRKVLLVDDDQDLADVLRSALETDNHYVVTVANNGVQALKQVMVHDYDVIVCDMLMPTMPGDMFYLAVQKTKPQLCRKFLFITGHSDNEKVDTFLRRVDGYAIFKPFTPDELVKAIEMVIRHDEEQTA